jgi:hypothetical protein
MGVTDSLVTEAMALQEGVIFAHLRVYPKVVMETGFLEVVNLWNTRHNYCFVVVPILLEIGELSVNFSHFVIQHVPRVATNRSIFVPSLLAH